jgi:hypothetical protein
MRISGNYFDRLWYSILPAAVFCGLVCGIFSTNKVQPFLWLGGMVLIIVWLIDTTIIFWKFGTHLNELVLTDEMLFNGIKIQPSQIIKIKIENIYPDSIISKWRITTIRLTLKDNSDLYILAKPHSIFFYIKYVAGIFRNYYRDRKRYRSGLQRGFAPLSSYFIKETSQTLDLLISKYPNLKLRVF